MLVNKEQSFILVVLHEKCVSSMHISCHFYLSDILIEGEKDASLSLSSVFRDKLHQRQLRQHSDLTSLHSDHSLGGVAFDTIILRLYTVFSKNIYCIIRLPALYHTTAVFNLSNVICNRTKIIYMPHVYYSKRERKTANYRLRVCNLLFDFTIVIYCAVVLL